MTSGTGRPVTRATGRKRSRAGLTQSRYTDFALQNDGLCTRNDELNAKRRWTFLQNPARTGEVHMSFPSWHGMDRWDPTFSTANSATVLRLLGVYGQEVEFSELPTTVQSKWLADFAGAVDVSSQDAMLDPGGLGGSQVRNAIIDRLKMSLLTDSHANIREKHADPLGRWRTVWSWDTNTVDDIPGLRSQRTIRLRCCG